MPSVECGPVVVNHRLGCVASRNLLASQQMLSDCHLQLQRIRCDSPYICSLQLVICLTAKVTGGYKAFTHLPKNGKWRGSVTKGKHSTRLLKFVLSHMTSNLLSILFVLYHNNNNNNSKKY